MALCLLTFKLIDYAQFDCFRGEGTIRLKLRDGHWEQIQHPLPGKTVRPWTERPRQPIVRGSDLVVGPLRCPVARSSIAYTSAPHVGARWQKRGVWSGMFEELAKRS